MSEITPNEILEKEFKKKLNGYDPSEVKEFLELVANYLSSVIKENNLLKRRVVSQKAQIEAYAKKENELMNALITAQKFSDDLKSQAEKEAELIIQRAKLEADSIILDAKKESDKILSHTNQQITLLNQKITELKRIRQELIIKLKSTLDYFHKVITIEENQSLDEFINQIDLEEDLKTELEPTPDNLQHEIIKDQKQENTISETERLDETQKSKENQPKTQYFNNELTQEIAEVLSEERQDDFIFDSEKTIDELKDEEILDWFIDNDNKKHT